MNKKVIGIRIDGEGYLWERTLRREVTHLTVSWRHQTHISLLGALGRAHVGILADCVNCQERECGLREYILGTIVCVWRMQVFWSHSIRRPWAPRIAQVTILSFLFSVNCTKLHSHWISSFLPQIINITTVHSLWVYHFHTSIKLISIRKTCWLHQQSREREAILLYGYRATPACKL